MLSNDLTQPQILSQVGDQWLLLLFCDIEFLFRVRFGIFAAHVHTFFQIFGLLWFHPFQWIDMINHTTTKSLEIQKNPFHAKISNAYT